MRHHILRPSARMAQCHEPIVQRSRMLKAECPFWDY